MFRELINKLRIKKVNLQKYKANNRIESNLIENETDITISKVDNIYKIEISDYISISDYIVKKNSNEEYYILDLICNCVLWNGSKQKINKGIYYVISMGNCIYNILFSEENIKIDERIKMELAEKDMTQERVITFNTDKNQYHYFSAKHDETGSTFYTKYYNEDRTNSFGALDLSEQETYDEISSVIHNLENIEGIEKILDIGMLKTEILEKLDKNLHKVKKL